MTIAMNPITPIPPLNPIMPVANITPFTYRDNYTYLRLLTALRVYITDVLVPEVDVTQNELVVILNGLLDEQAANVNATVAEMVEYVDLSTAESKAYVDAAVASIINATIEVSDPVMFGVVDDTDTQTRGLIDQIIDDSMSVQNGVVYAYQYGVRANVATDQKANLHAAFAAAEALGGGAVIQLPAGIIQINGTFALANYSSGLVGTGASAKSLNPTSVVTGTVLKGAAQTGPVLDFTGYKWPNAQRGRAIFRDFSVMGDGVVNTLNKGIALVDPVSAASTFFQNITIYNTGGIGLHIKNWYLSEFHGIVVHNPVNAAANDTPYVLIEGGNGNRWYGLGVRSLIFDDTADVGVSGAIVVKPGTTYQAHKSLFVGGWAENLHVPQNGTIIYNEANEMVWQDFEFFDCFKVAGAVNTTHYVLAAPATQNYGGNIIRGTIPGHGTGPLDIDCGVKLNQRNNLLDGPKGYNGGNVIIGVDVDGCTVHLRGGVANPTGNGVTDNSGRVTNTIIDEFSGVHIYGAATGSAVNMKLGDTEILHKRNSYNLTANGAPNMVTGINSFRYTLGADITITAPTNIQNKIIYLAVIQDATGGRVYTFSLAAGAYKFPGGAQPAGKSTAANKIDRYTFEWSGTYWECIAMSQGL